MSERRAPILVIGPPEQPWGEPIVLRVEPPPPPPPPARRRWMVPLALFLATCASTWIAGDWVYALGVMTILTAHELGHYFQSVRYRIPASLPYFLPMPFSPLGTLGAIISMQARIAHARALFDVAITGPLAGLVPTMIFSIIGLKLSTVVPTAGQAGVQLGEPLLFKLLSHLTLGPLPDDQTVLLHPLAFAGWVGLLVTSLNLVPIGQLDGGHILYALIGRRAHKVALALLGGAVVAVVVGGYWSWVLMILLLMLIGPLHPPTADDDMPLGRTRQILGWATLLFLIVGFTPTPIVSFAEIPPTP